jgi:hypothetical protein
MKTKEQIQAKIKEHEDKINEVLAQEQNDVNVMLIESYLIGRKALLWTLADEDYIELDSFEMDARFEITCIESTKIF